MASDTDSFFHLFSGLSHHGLRLAVKNSIRDNMLPYRTPVPMTAGSDSFATNLTVVVCAMYNKAIHRQSLHSTPGPIACSTSGVMTNSSKAERSNMVTTMTMIKMHNCDDLDNDDDNDDDDGCGLVPFARCSSHFCFCFFAQYGCCSPFYLMNGFIRGYYTNCGIIMAIVFFHLLSSDDRETLHALRRHMQLTAASDVMTSSVTLCSEAALRMISTTSAFEVYIYARSCIVAGSFDVYHQRWLNRCELEVISWNKLKWPSSG